MEEMKRLCKLYNEEKKRQLKLKKFKFTRELEKISKQIKEVITSENVTLLIKYKIFYVLLFLDFEKFKEELKKCKYKMSKEITNLLHFYGIIDKCYLPKVNKRKKEFIEFPTDADDFENADFTTAQIVYFLKVMSHKKFSDSLVDRITRLSMQDKITINVLRKYHPQLIDVYYLLMLDDICEMNMFYLF